MPYITEHDSSLRVTTPRKLKHVLAYFRVSKYLLNRWLDVYGLLGQVEGFICLKLDLQFFVLKGEHLESTKIPLNPSIERHHIILPLKGIAFLWSHLVFNSTAVALRKYRVVGRPMEDRFFARGPRHWSCVTDWTTL